MFRCRVGAGHRAGAPAITVAIIHPNRVIMGTSMWGSGPVGLRAGTWGPLLTHLHSQVRRGALAGLLADPAEPGVPRGPRGDPDCWERGREGSQQRRTPALQVQGAWLSPLAPERGTHLVGSADWELEVDEENTNVEMRMIGSKPQRRRHGLP